MLTSDCVVCSAALTPKRQLLTSVVVMHNMSGPGAVDRTREPHHTVDIDNKK